MMSRKLILVLPFLAAVVCLVGAYQLNRKPS